MNVEENSFSKPFLVEPILMINPEAAQQRFILDLQIQGDDLQREDQRKFKCQIAVLDVSHSVANQCHQHKVYIVDLDEQYSQTNKIIGVDIKSEA